MILAARLRKLEKSLEEGFAGGCAVCAPWGWTRDVGQPGDPWANFGACPVCGRRPELVSVEDPAAGEAVAAEYAAAGYPLKLLVGVSLAAL